MTITDTGTEKFGAEKKMVGLKKTASVLCAENMWKNLLTRLNHLTMIKYKIKRLFHGQASVRDYIVVKAMNEKQDIEIICKDERMIIDWQDLHKGKQCPDIFTSKHDGKQYRLIDFEWKPQIQPSLFKLSTEQV